jgi:hypothetical protein
MAIPVMNLRLNLKHEFQSRRVRSATGLALVWFVLVVGVQSQLADVLPDAEALRFHRHALALPGARQAGVGCAFYANVPALTFVSGIHVVDETRDSRAFVTGIYGLRRGDFLMRRAFDKEIFFELFGIPSKGVTIYYEDLDRKILLKQAEQLVAGEFEAALDRGQFISLRVYGELGMPHNVLLLARRNGRYHFHDPTTGTIRVTGAAGLAARILTESKKGGSKLKKRYFSSYHLVSLGEAVPSDKRPLRLDQLPESLEIRLGGSQRAHLAKCLKPAVALAEGESGVEAWMKAFPRIDFAAVTRNSGDSMKAVSVIDPQLRDRDLRGLAHIAKLSLNSYQIGARELLPVWMIGGRPWVVTGYAKPAGEGDATMTVFDGENSRVMPMTEAFGAVQASGSVVGHVVVPRE